MSFKYVFTKSLGESSSSMYWNFALFFFSIWYKNCLWVKDIFALVLKLIFSKRIPYTHHLVFSFYYFSFLFIVLTLLTALNLMGEIPDWVNQLFWLFSLLYLWGAIHNFYQYSWKRSFFRSLLVLSINLLFIIPLSFVLVLITSFVFY